MTLYCRDANFVVSCGTNSFVETTFCAANDDKVYIMKTLGFQCSQGPVSI